MSSEFETFCSHSNKTKIYRTIILPVVLYGCEAWLLTAREERKLRVFEKCNIFEIGCFARTLKLEYHSLSPTHDYLFNASAARFYVRKPFFPFQT